MHQFIFVIDRDAPKEAVQEIGAKLPTLEDSGILFGFAKSGPLVQKVSEGFPKKILLKTETEPDQIELCLQGIFGDSYEHCRIEWP